MKNQNYNRLKAISNLRSRRFWLFWHSKKSFLPAPKISNFLWHFFNQKKQVWVGSTACNRINHSQNPKILVQQRLCWNFVCYWCDQRLFGSHFKAQTELHSRNFSHILSAPFYTSRRGCLAKLAKDIELDVSNSVFSSNTALQPVAFARLTALLWCGLGCCSRMIQRTFVVMEAREHGRNTRL